MGRPYTINYEQYQEVLQQCLRCYFINALDSSSQIYSAFLKFPKTMRPQLWQQMATILSRSTLQIKNYFFNTWTEKLDKDVKSSSTIFHNEFEFSTGFSIFD
ncbi:Conserved_hypothetical protein [Hexamita inflata]|uniref:Uncharacterized protein n=1 Tax=Hexamita inflata TaxID=28002 RepID=A0AA86Q9H7_9EUKA|nr:Conserved hypothetical protein [Hexamita inflata]